jgi:hypothetical protein
MRSDRFTVTFALATVVTTLHGKVVGLEVCPGDNDRNRPDHTCPNDGVCATLLDAQEQARSFGSSGDFWKIFGESDKKWTKSVQADAPPSVPKMRAKDGDSWCI